MIQSMTGFANKNIILTAPNNNKSTVTISLKSLNSRFFEANCKMPYILSHFETKLIKMFKDRLYRGYITLYIQVGNLSIFKGTIDYSLATVQGYVNAVDAIKKQCNINDSLSLDTLVMLPNIFSVEEKELDEQLMQIILNSIDELIRDVIEERNREGHALLKDLMQQGAVIKTEIEIIEKRAKQLMQQQKEKVKIEFQELQGDASMLAEARKNALYQILDKIDIHEEIIRFKVHLENFQEQLQSKEIEKGKRLDFILQELGREINTITAKCSDAEIGTRAINVKVSLEKAREQTQNIV